MNPSPTPAERAPTHEALAPVVDALHRCATSFDLAVRARLNLGPQGYLAVQYLLASDKDIGMAELGDVLGITAGSCTILVNRLERAGHLRRQPDLTDRRRTNVVVTDPTRQVVLAARGTLDTAVHEVSRDFTPDQRDAIGRFLAAIARTYSDAALTKPRTP